MDTGVKKDFVILDNARTQEQRLVMDEILQKGECPFCRGNLPNRNEVIKKGNYWFLIPNLWPYDNTRIHLLAIHEQHAESLGDVPSEEWWDLFQLLRWAENEYKIRGGCIGIRFGDPSLNAGTIRHLHAHLIVPEITDTHDQDYKTVKLKIA